MGTFKLPSVTFYKLKRMLDGAVLWRQIDKDTVEIKPVFKYAKALLEKQLA